MFSIFYGFKYVDKSSDNDHNYNNNKETKTKNNFSDFVDKVTLPPKKTKILVLGLDKYEVLTDSIFVLCFDREICFINVLSIPRDTYIKLSSNMLKNFRDIKKKPPNVMKVNAIHSWAGKKFGNDLAKKQIEELLNIKLDYYIAINMSALRKIVDMTGGIYMDIPEKGLNYDDPVQNLHIHIKGGRQLLNGQMAEGVVRFRKGYKRADLQRIEVQQQFMREFFSQALTKENLKNNIIGLLTTFLQDVQTDFNITNITKYSRYINKINSESIAFDMLPGNTKTIDKVSYYICDKKNTQQLIDKIFYSSNKKTLPENYKIKILDGSNDKNIAINKKILLEKNNYKVSQIENYAGEKKEATRIVTSQKNIGTDLKKFFNNSVFEIDNKMPEEFDIIIITGTI
jgi:LCP family protein required for cell wall assembly